MKGKKGLGNLDLMGSMGGPSSRASLPPPMSMPPMKRAPVMKQKGTPLSGFAPAPRKAKKKIRKGSGMPPGLMI